MRFPEVLKQPSRFVAAALVTACLIALAAAIGGFLLIDGVTRTALAVKPVASSTLRPIVDSGEGAPARGTEATEPAADSRAGEHAPGRTNSAESGRLQPATVLAR